MIKNIKHFKNDICTPKTKRKVHAEKFYSIKKLESAICSEALKSLLVCTYSRSISSKCVHKMLYLFCNFD